MARQTGLVKFNGTIGGLTFYKRLFKIYLLIFFFITNRLK